ncbi:FCD domain-containing protein [Gordonia sp. CPCC 205515]|uniref:FadR/GntR family transcriptional regulator n=1 Tax=Gordonia sp. CPCC 205515 TaxID=3140791 RepID=UPI003AF3E1D8
MTDTTHGAASDPIEPPDIPALTPEIWHGAMNLPGTVPVGLSRAELAANKIARLSGDHQPGDRIGSKDDLRQVCQVSVGTINEAIKLALERGIITSRPGPGGGIFAAEPPPLSRMNGWFREAAGDVTALPESIQIRDALAPLLVSEVMTRLTDADIDEFNDLLGAVHKAHDRRDVPGFIWAAWNVHEHFAGLGRSQLLDSLYLSIMDVGTSHVRARLQQADDDGTRDVAVYFEDFAQVIEDFVVALSNRDAPAAIDALRRTDPSMMLRAPVDETTTATR